MKKRIIQQNNNKNTSINKKKLKIKTNNKNIF
jgi:hypothetical protein